MHKVSMRALRNHGGDVLSRVMRGESIVVTRDGAEVAELRPLPRRAVSAVELVARRRDLPRVDLASLRSDLDAVIDAAL